MKKQAFTLAELAIVLVVMGVLGLIALSILTSSEAKNKAMSENAKSMYLQVEKATRNIILKDTNNYTLERMKDATGEFSVASSSSLTRLIELYKKNMLLKRGSIQSATYLSSELNDGTIALTGITPSFFNGFTLKNDSYVGFYLNGNCTTTIGYIYDPLTPEKRSIENTCGLIFYDVNGDKIPNLLGVDQFILALGKLGLK